MTKLENSLAELMKFLAEIKVSSSQQERPTDQRGTSNQRYTYSQFETYSSQRVINLEQLFSLLWAKLLSGKIYI